MKKIPLLFVLFFLSCNKENIEDNSVNDSLTESPVPSTISLTNQNCGYITFVNCKFSYTDIEGNIFQNVLDNDEKVENVDFSKPFRCDALSGHYSYYPGGGSSVTYETCDYILKKDGVVIDIQTVSNYTYQN